MKIAVVGAGIAGLACASALTQRSIAVEVFDKARGAGGRMTSKRGADGYLDLGAQYFTARDPRFIAQVQRWQQQGVVSPWLAAIYQYQASELMPSPDLQLRYIGVPAMHSPLQQLAQGLSVHYQTHIAALKHDQSGWWLTDQQQNCYGPYSDVVFTLPPQQLAALLPEQAKDLPTSLLQPCWAVNLELTTPTGVAAGGIFIKDPAAPVSWVARQNSKPGRATTESWLIHFSPEFSQQFIDAGPDFLQQQATAFLSALLQQSLTVVSMISHRWRYAQLEKTEVSLPENPLSPGLWFAGDWANGGRVENAWLSGLAVAEQISHE